MGFSPESVAEWIGHQGPEGYHTQELIDFALADGWTVTAIQRHPVTTHPESGSLREIQFKDKTHRLRMARHMSSGSGVLLGRKPYDLVGHALVWESNGQQTYNPSTGLYAVNPMMNDEEQFQIEVFLRMDDVL
jgi:hypothetical protein